MSIEEIVAMSCVVAVVVVLALIIHAQDSKKAESKD